MPSLSPSVIAVFPYALSLFSSGLQEFSFYSKRREKMDLLLGNIDPIAVKKANDPGQCGAIVNYPPSSVSDNCPIVQAPVRQKF